MCTKTVIKRMFDRRARRSHVIAIQKFANRGFVAALMRDIYYDRKWILVMNTNNPRCDEYLRSLRGNSARWTQLRLWQNNG